nr:CMRF35-like molecule 5 [Anolis sagrei ordinatus]
MDSLQQWHLIARALFLLTGFTSVLVDAEEMILSPGNSLVLVFPYEDIYKNSIKSWCQGADWSTCMTVVKTDGTEEAVKNGRTTIKDNQTTFQLTVTLENLIEKDTGKYWGIIEKEELRILYYVSLQVLPAALVNASLDDKEDLISVNIIHQMTSTSRPQYTVTTEKSTSIELSSSSFPILDSRSLSYPIYLPFLISVGSKMLIFLCLGFAMYRKNRRSSDHVASETPS